ncbi:hypothetical protein ACOBV8_18395 (plasmid) [Pseudoalteromonas espejiana]
MVFWRNSGRQSALYGLEKISAGTFEFKDNLLVDPFILSAFALTGIIGLTYLAVTAAKSPAKTV